MELPPLPQIMAGMNQTIMLSLSMVVIAALVGASGLGVPVVRALNSVNTALGFESGIIIVVVAIMLDRMLRVGGVMTDRNAVEFDNVNIVFGENPQAALPLMDQGAGPHPIKAETGQVLGVHNCSLSVREGEILVLMGLSGSGKSTLLRRSTASTPSAAARCGSGTAMAWSRSPKPRGRNCAASGANGSPWSSAIRSAALALGPRKCRAGAGTGRYPRH